ncbi:MAG: FAD-dependent oxidoreductase [Gemmatimonadaceae bacterium]|nr:FAD-dependent oxidoreductase [Gemmatimonadaceae bacterium]
MTRTSADVVIIGAGVSGLCSALALADDGLDVVLVSDVRPGEASAAAGGILDTAHGCAATDPGLQAVFRQARDLWPAFTASLCDRTGVPVPMNRDGILELATSIHAADALRDRAGVEAEWLDAAALTALEPQLGHAKGALRHRHDGAVNPLVLLRALKAAVGRHVHVRIVTGTVAGISPGAAGAATGIALADGTAISTMRVVLAAGVWSGDITGLPSPLPLAPLKGQMISVASRALRHVVMLGDGYAIPRGDGRTILGTTAEHAGFDARHTEEGVQAIRALATAILPALGSAGLLNAWAGFRPMTPDGLPIIGPDPIAPSLIYACGHGRNGILLAPLTGQLVHAAVTLRPARTDGNAFSPLRLR